jgi:hypothetical protein
VFKNLVYIFVFCLCCSLELEASKSTAVGNSERHGEIIETLKQKHETLEADRKVCHNI